jgi:hypothetical protein
MSPASLVACIQLAILSLAVFFVNRHLFYQHQAKAKSLFYTFGVVCTVVFGGSVFVPLLILSQATPVIYDPVLYRIEALGGLHVAGFVQVLSILAHRMAWICMTVYSELPVIVIFAASSQLVYSKWHFRDNLFIQFILGAFLGYALYYLLPAVGPGPYFRANFPASMPNPSLIPIHPTYFSDGGLTPRNAMPSMHAAWAIMSFLALRNSPFSHRVLGILYVIVTFITTIGFGFHYILDWVVALPLVLLIRGLTVAQPFAGPRSEAIIVGGLLLVSWCAIIRLAPNSLAYTVFIQAVIAASISLPILMEIRLARAAIARPFAETETVRVRG